MERLNAIAALKGKLGEIADRVDALQDQFRQALIDLDHVDCTILSFDPDAELDEIKAKPMPSRHHAFKGQVTRAILDMLRKSDAAAKQPACSPFPVEAPGPAVIPHEHELAAFSHEQARLVVLVAPRRIRACSTAWF